MWLPSYNPWLISCCSFPLDATKQLPPIKAWTPGSLKSTFSPKVVLLQALVKGKSWWWLLRRAKYYVALSGESAVIAVRAFVACPPPTYLPISCGSVLPAKREIFFFPLSPSSRSLWLSTKLNWFLSSSNILQVSLDKATSCCPWWIHECVHEK